MISQTPNTAVIQLKNNYFLMWDFIQSMFEDNQGKLKAKFYKDY